jgi:serine/threonine-protein kinase
MEGVRMSQLFSRLEKALSPGYRLISVLSCGGAAHVYIGDDVKHGRRVAIKVLREELAATVSADRFLAEIRVAAQLSHPNIVPLYDSGSALGLPYYVMPFIEGESLRAYMSRTRRVPLDVVVRLISEVGGALDYAHSRRLIHRDIKPENVILDAHRAMVLDFGIALALDFTDHPRRTLPGLMPGTPEYMSPEQAIGAAIINERSDIYSLACVAYEMIAGEPPFTGAASLVTGKHIRVKPRPLSRLCSDVPGSVAGAIGRALAKVPADRFATAGAFVRALSDAWAEASGSRMLSDEAYALRLRSIVRVS